MYGYDTGSEPDYMYEYKYNGEYRFESYTFKPKTDAEIIRELEENGIYYKVASIEFDKLQSPTKE